MIDFYPKELDPEIKALQDSGTSKEEVKKLQDYLLSKNDKSNLKDTIQKIPLKSREPNMERRIHKSKENLKPNLKTGKGYDNSKDEIKDGLDQYYNPNQMPTNSRDVVWHHNGEKRKNPQSVTTLGTIQEEGKKYYKDNLTVIDI